MVDMTFCGNCICIDYILCNISIIDWKKICWWCSHILWRPWPRFKNKKSFRKDEYMFLFDMPCQKWLGLTMATLWSVSITIPFFLLHFQSMTSASWYWAGHWNMLPYSKLEHKIKVTYLQKRFCPCERKIIYSQHTCTIVGMQS